MPGEWLHAPGRRLGRLAEQVGGRLTALPRRWRIAGIVLLAAAQLAVPVRWILGFERTLAEGRSYRFRAAPVDPADPLRGRYVVLGYAAAEEVPVPAGLDLAWDERVWVRAVEGPDGFALLRSPTRERPAQGDFLRARVAGFPGPDERVVRLRLPFDRFFLEEGAAPAAERLLWGGRGPQWEGAAEPPDIWAEVRLRDGQAVLADVLVDGVSLAEAAAVSAGAPRAAPAAPPAVSPAMPGAPDEPVAEPAEGGPGNSVAPPSRDQAPPAA